MLADIADAPVFDFLAASPMKPRLWYCQNDFLIVGPQASMCFNSGMKLPVAVLAVCSTGMAQLAVRPAVTGGLRVEGSKLIDGAGRELLLQGTEVPISLGLEYAGTMFSTIRQRWNMNMVRLPVSVARSEREPDYLVHVAELVRRANQAELFVILAATEEGAALPTARTRVFWTKWAAYFKNSPLVGFDLFSEPGAEAAPRPRAGGDWRVWRDAMQNLNSIRRTGSRQTILAMVFENQFPFEGLSEEWYLAGGNIIYERSVPTQPVPRQRRGARPGLRVHGRTSAFAGGRMGSGLGERG